MRSVDPDRWKSLAGQIRWIAVAFATGFSWFGVELEKALWGPHDRFYTFKLLLWGFLSAFFARAIVAYLRQLRYSVSPALADEKDKEARSLMPYIFGSAFTAFCFTTSILPAQRFGTLGTIGAAISGMLTALTIVLTERKIRKVARSFYPPANRVSA